MSWLYWPTLPDWSSINTMSTLASHTGGRERGGKGERGESWLLSYYCTTERSKDITCRCCMCVHAHAHVCSLHVYVHVHACVQVFTQTQLHKVGWHDRALNFMENHLMITSALKATPVILPPHPPPPLFASPFSCSKHIIYLWWPF